VWIVQVLSTNTAPLQQPLPVSLRTQAASGHKENGEKVKGDWFSYPEMAAGGLWTTPSYLARFIIELQKSKAGKSNRVLSVEMAAEMLSGQMDRARYIGSQPSLRMEWRVNPHVTFMANYTYFFSGTFLSETGPGRNINYLMTQLTYKF
jgi:hypothetical protein